MGFENRRSLRITAAKGMYVGYWSPWIIAELARVLSWRWVTTKGDTPAQWAACSAASKTMMGILTATFITVDPKPPHPMAWVQLGDAGDVPVWAAAVAANVRYVVSENTRHFPPADAAGVRAHRGIVYITATVFLGQIESVR